MRIRTKFILTYLGGIFTGIALTFVFAFIAASIWKSTEGNSSPMGNDVVLFEKPQQEIKVSSFKVIQVLSDGSALAMVDDFHNFGLTVLFLADKGTSFYDDQKIDVPSRQKVMQIGTYKYETIQEMTKTIPVVEIVDK